MQMQITEERHKGHLIKAGKAGKGARANVFREGSPRVCHHEIADKVEGAIAAAKAWIDQNREENDGNRTEREGMVVGSQADFEHALRTITITPKQLLMLQAHYRAPKHTLSATELAHAAGYKNFELANSTYGRLGRAVAEAAGLPPPPATRQKEAVIWTGVLAWDAGAKDEEGRFLWRMHDPLVRAIRALNMG